MFQTTTRWISNQFFYSSNYVSHGIQTPTYRSFKSKSLTPCNVYNVLSHSGAVIQGRVIVTGMTRGNQREQDRLKAQKKAAQQKKPKESASTLAKRKEADAEKLRAKQKKAEEAKASASSGK